MKKYRDSKEVLLVVCIVLGITGLFFLNNKENPAMLGFTPHPYFVISILIAAFYGFRLSVVTSLLCTGLYFTLLNSQLDYDEVETILDFEFLSMPLSMIFISMLVGELKQRTIRSLDEANTTIQEKQTLLENEKRKNDVLDQELSELKKRLVSKLETMEEMYDIGLGLYKNNIDELFPNFLVILHKHLEIEGASIYLESKSKVNDGKFVLAKGFPFTDDFPHEINSFTTEDIIFRKAYKNKKLVTIRDVTTKEEYSSWNKETVISIPVVVSNEIHAMVNIHQIPFLKYTPTTFKTLELLVKWLSQSLQYAMNYEGYSKYSVLDETLHIYKNDYFFERLEEEVQEFDKYKRPFTVIKINANDFDNISEVKKIPYKKLLSDICLRMTRRKDCVAQGERDGEFFLIIPNMDDEACRDFEKKIMVEINKFVFTNEDHKTLDFKTKSYFVNDSKIKVESILEGLNS